MRDPMNPADVPSRTDEARREAAARRLGFGVRTDARQLERDLRDALVGLESPEFLATECAAPLGRVFAETFAWMLAGALLWGVLAAIC